MDEEDSPSFAVRMLWLLAKLAAAGVFGFLAAGAYLKSIPPGEHGFAGNAQMLMALAIFGGVSLLSIVIVHLLGNSLSSQSRLVLSLIIIPIALVSGLTKAIAILWVAVGIFLLYVAYKIRW